MNERGINILATKYVKFLRGTPSAYEKATKYDDTLYFISEPGDSNITLYLGEKLVAGDDLSKGSIDALKDVMISEGLADKQILVYDALNELWVNKNANEALDTYVGATANTAGVAGLVPPTEEVGQTNLFLRSDGKWAEIAGGAKIDNHIVNIFNESRKSHEVILQEAAAQFTPEKGDLIIIIDTIIGDYEQRTAYTYADTWIALNSNVVSEKQVIIVDDYANEATSGKNLGEVLDIILSKPSVSADDVSISIENNVASLKNFGKQYYHFIEGDNAHYELQIVDDEHPWKPGLEPRTVEENGELVIGWYEPNTATIGGVNAAIATLQGQVNELDAELSDKADKNAVYTKEETDAQIAAAAHLKRKEVESTDDIDVTADDATQYIYMVPSGLTDDDNKYYEYIVVEVDIIDEETDEKTKAKKIEKVGSWEVNLSEYAKKTEVNNALGLKVDKVDGSFLMTQEQANKLAGIEAGAQVNKIEAVDGSFSIGENKTLHLNSIAISKVTNLEDLLNKKVDKVDNARLITNDEAAKLNSLLGITSVSSDFQVVDGKLSFVPSASSTIATKSDVQELASKVDEIATWGEL